MGIENYDDDKRWYLFVENKNVHLNMNTEKVFI